jgi:hypothetical protein
VGRMRFLPATLIQNGSNPMDPMKKSNISMIKTKCLRKFKNNCPVYERNLNS